MEEPAKNTSVNAEAVEQQIILLTVQVLWACVWNTTRKKRRNRSLPISTSTCHAEVACPCMSRNWAARNTR